MHINTFSLRRWGALFGFCFGLLGHAQELRQMVYSSDLNSVTRAASVPARIGAEVDDQSVLHLFEIHLAQEDGPKETFRSAVLKTEDGTPWMRMDCIYESAGPLGGTLSQLVFYSPDPQGHWNKMSVLRLTKDFRDLLDSGVLEMKSSLESRGTEIEKEFQKNILQYRLENIQERILIQLENHLEFSRAIGNKKLTEIYTERGTFEKNVLRIGALLFTAVITTLTALKWGVIGGVGGFVFGMTFLVGKAADINVLATKENQLLIRWKDSINTRAMAAAAAARTCREAFGMAR